MAQLTAQVNALFSTVQGLIVRLKNGEWQGRWKYHGNSCILYLQIRLLCCMSKICSCTAPLLCQRALQMLHTQYNAMQTIMVQKVQRKICKIYTMQSCIQNRMRAWIRKLHVARSTIMRLLHLQLHAALYVRHNTCTLTTHCNRATPSTKATQNQFEHNKKILVLK